MRKTLSVFFSTPTTVARLEGITAFLSLFIASIFPAAALPAIPVHRIVLLVVRMRLNLAGLSFAARSSGDRHRRICGFNGVDHRRCSSLIAQCGISAKTLRPCTFEEHEVVPTEISPQKVAKSLRNQLARTAALGLVIGQFPNHFSV